MNSKTFHTVKENNGSEVWKGRSELYQEEKFKRKEQAGNSKYKNKIGNP